MAIKLGNNVFIKRGSRPTPLSKYETKDLNDINAIPYPIQSDIEKNNNYLCQYKKMFKTNLGYNFSPAIRGDLLMTSSCDIGNVVILNLEKAFIDDKFFNLKTSSLLEKQYLKYWIIKNKKEISEIGYGTTFNVLYIEPFSKYLNTKFVPDIKTQQEIINIIEPKEQLFLKYHNIVDISDIDKFNASWYNLINIIEPFEKIKFSLTNKIDLINDMFFTQSKTQNVYGKMIENNITFERGKNVSSDLLSTNKSDIAFINISAINNNQNKWIMDNVKFQNNVFYGDVILSLDGTIGLVNNFLEGYNGYGYKVFSEKIKNSQIYISLLSSINKKIIKENSNGSVIKHASKSIDKLLLLNVKNDFIFEMFYKLQIQYKKMALKINLIIKKLIDMYIV